MKMTNEDPTTKCINLGRPRFLVAFAFKNNKVLKMLVKFIYTTRLCPFQRNGWPENGGQQNGALGLGE
jgi:hypothetical protein